MSAIFPDKKDIESRNYSRAMEEQEIEKQFMKKILRTEESKTLWGLGYRDPLPRHFEFIVDDLIKRNEIMELPPQLGHKKFIATRKERLEELLERIEANENEWGDWVNLADYYYQRNLWDKLIICMETVEKILGNSFENTVRLKNKKRFAWGYIQKARELLNYNDNNFKNSNNIELTNYFNTIKKAKELYCKASRLYTNFYNEQHKIDAATHQKFIFKSKDSGYNPRAILQFDYNKESIETYEIVDGIPIYYIILKDFVKLFGMTYEQLWGDIENKSL